MNIVITGNSQGLGKKVESHLTSKGHTVIGLSRSGTLKCDVTDYEQVEDCSRYVLDAYEYADALICCAGTLGTLGKISSSNPSDWANVVNTNLNGVYNTFRAFYPIMDLARRPKIMCFGGGGASASRPYFSAYAASKTGLTRLVETIADEEPNLDINIIAPGTIKTNMIQAPIDFGPSVIGEFEYNKAKAQMQEEDNLENTLKLIDWLLSEKSDGVSGRMISSKWDNWEALPKNNSKDLYKLRRVT
jgi:3-oxoacyl-[acyl-carrier protein] reductase